MQKQEDLWEQSGLYSELQDTQDYTEKSISTPLLI